MGFTYTNRKKKSYFLHKKSGKGCFFFFCSTIKEGHCDMPEGYEVVENFRTNFPLMKKVVK